MKGQFMLISSVLMGFIVISAATTISNVQQTSFSSEDDSNTVEMIKDSAEQVNHGDSREVENFIKMVSSISSYQTTTKHWRSQSCFNVTLERSDTQLQLNCIG